MSGLALVRAIRGLDSEYSQLPIIAISGHDDQSRRIELFHAGVNDYVTKPIIKEELRARVTNLITSKKLVDRVRSQQTRLQDLALRDSLTGCNNRHCLTELAPRFIADAKRHHHELCLLIIDLDKFKHINDARGHIAGDVVLSEVGKLLTGNSREGDFVVRFGGEEFIVLLSYHDIRLGEKNSEQFRKKIENLNPDNIPVTASIGVTSLATSEANDFDRMFQVADKAVYLAKENGRNCVEVIKKLESLSKSKKKVVRVFLAMHHVFWEVSQIGFCNLGFISSSNKHSDVLFVILDSAHRLESVIPAYAGIQVSSRSVLDAGSRPI